MRSVDTHKVEMELSHAMSVSDLMSFLKGMDEDAKVVFACDYGDHYHTQQALPVQHVDELCEEEPERIVDSAYSHSGIAVDSLDERDWDNDYEDEFLAACKKDEDEGRQNVVVLRYSK